MLATSTIKKATRLSAADRKRPDEPKPSPQDVKRVGSILSRLLQRNGEIEERMSPAFHPALSLDLKAVTLRLQAMNERSEA